MRTSPAGVNPSMLVEDLDLMYVEPQTFDQLSSNAIEFNFDGYPLRVPSKGDLIALKLHAIRCNPKRLEKDLQDIAKLVRLSEGAITMSDLEKLSARFGTDDILSLIRSHLSHD